MVDFNFGIAANLYWKANEYRKAIDYFLKLIPITESYAMSRGDKKDGKAISELYYKLGLCQIKIGQKAQGCLNLKKAIEIRPNDKYSRDLNFLCN
jgi:tetratricopeptide (TPR) repeat protein